MCEKMSKRLGGIIVHGVFLFLFWCPWMAIKVSLQNNGGFLPDIQQYC